MSSPAAVGEQCGQSANFHSDQLAGTMVYKIAEEPHEFEQIHRLNYETFAEEIPQHLPNPERRLIDRFHSENTYWIARCGQKVVAMVALRGSRPFSLESKLPDLGGSLPPDSRPMEVRLLAVDARYRRTWVCAHLLRHSMTNALNQGFDLGIISGTTRQLKLYRHLGFVPFGPLVGKPGAMFQPMYLTLRSMTRAIHSGSALRTLAPPSLLRSGAVNFLPGPVSVSPGVQAAFHHDPISHRGNEFSAVMRRVQTKLCEITGANHVQVVLGSGTLANGMIAAQLAASGRPGLIVSNGEFGERLIEEGNRHGLVYAAFRFDWSEAWDLKLIAAAVGQLSPGDWVWCVHHETSTGRLNPLEEIKSICANRGVKFCVDAVSSLGAAPLDLRGTAFASSTSGKALSALPGLGLVFHEQAFSEETRRIPAYLDLGLWASRGSTPFTHSSNLLRALDAALNETTDFPARKMAEQTAWLARELKRLEVKLITSMDEPFCGVLTFQSYPGLASTDLGAELERRGFCLSFRSRHLVARGWLQISLFGHPSRENLEDLLHELRGLLRLVAPDDEAKSRLAIRPDPSSIDHPAVTHRA